MSMRRPVKKPAHVPGWGGTRVKTRHCCVAEIAGVDRSKRYAGLAAQVSRLRGEVCRAVQRRRHLGCNCSQAPVLAAGSVCRRAP